MKWAYVLSKTIFLVAFWLNTAVSHASDSSKITGIHPTLLGLEKHLKPIILAAQPEAAAAFEGGQFIARYQTQKFLIHQVVSKMGHISPKPYEAIGPNVDGFLLTIRIEKEANRPRGDGAAFVPRVANPPASPHEPDYRLPTGTTEEEQYWRTIIKTYPLKGKHEYVVMTLAFGWGTVKSGVHKTIIEAVTSYLDSFMPHPVFPPPHPTFAKLESRLRAVVLRQQPQATVGFDDELRVWMEPERIPLIARYQTQTFRIHRRDATGKFTGDSAETGPNSQGFMLELSLLKRPYYGRPGYPYGVSHEPYWDNFINEYLLNDKSGVVLMKLAYGGDADKNLLAAIKETVAEVLSPHAEPLYKEEMKKEQ